LGSIYWGTYEEEKTLTYLQKVTVRFYKNITYPTQRSVNNFVFLVGIPNGRMLH